ncbi:hypothetical protein E0698_03925 [Paenibacillus sp. 23TSA30-6]|nr:hypothetical protein [Paenibacillus sp. 23TSA30-6]
MNRHGAMYVGLVASLKREEDGKKLPYAKKPDIVFCNSIFSALMLAQRLSNEKNYYTNNSKMIQ